MKDKQAENSMGVEAIALKLAEYIAKQEGASVKLDQYLSDPRAYWLDLYGECLKKIKEMQCCEG